MEDLQDFSPAAVVVLTSVGLVALPLVGASLIWSALKRLAPDGFFAVPPVHTMARFVGVGLGLISIIVQQDSRNFDLHAIFVPDGPWDISFAEFLLDRVNPIGYWPIAFLDELGKPRDVPWIGIAVLMALLLFSIGWAWKIWKPRLAGRATLCIVIIVLAVAYLTIYGISLLFWLLFLLNSWTFLLLFLALQYFRGRL